MYVDLYAPMHVELMKIHLMTVNSRLAPRFRARWENALDKLRTIKRRRIALNAACKALFDTRETEERGEVEYGGTFPIDRIERLVHDHPLHCDDKLLMLLRQAISTRIQDAAAPHDVTADDVRLFRHIFRQRDRLKRVYDR